MRKPHLTPMQQRFAEYYMQGMDKEEAYLKAGYKAQKDRHTNLAKVSDILNYSQVKDYLEQIREETKERIMISQEEMFEKYMEIFELGKEFGQLSASKGALDSVCKMTGLIEEKKAKVEVKTADETEIVVEIV